MRYFFTLLFMAAISSYGQSSTDTTAIKKVVDSINREVDKAVVQKNIPYLQQHFADDFKFTHGTGMIDTKASWIGKAQSSRVQYVSREHDSTEVELHGDIAIVTGSLKVILPKEAPKYGYIVRYERVYHLRNKIWQMISHRTTAEWDIQQ